jgi:hypothetical protein
MPGRNPFRRARHEPPYRKGRCPHYALFKIFVLMTEDAVQCVQPLSVPSDGMDTVPGEGAP